MTEAKEQKTLDQIIDAHQDKPPKPTSYAPPTVNIVLNDAFKNTSPGIMQSAIEDAARRIDQAYGRHFIKPNRSFNWKAQGGAAEEARLKALESAAQIRGMQETIQKALGQRALDSLLTDDALDRAQRAQYANGGIVSEDHVWIDRDGVPRRKKSKRRKKK